MIDGIEKSSSEPLRPTTLFGRLEKSKNHFLTQNKGTDEEASCQRKY